MERRLWYRQEAADWNEALPLGNGRLGGMVFGGPEKERIQLNEDSVWSGGFRERSNPYCRKNLEELRRLIAEGNSNCTVSFTSGGVRYRQEAYISATAQVLVLRLTADRPGVLNFRARIHRNRAYDRSWAEDGRFVAFSGSNGDLSFCAMLTEAHQGGSVFVVGEYLTAQNVSEVVLYFTAATTFYQKESASWCRKTLEDACSQPEEALRSSHLREYWNYFDPTSLALTGGDCIGIPTDQQLKAVQEGGVDPGLFSLYFDFGRYLLISSSRPGTQPANLQGIWNQDMFPAWDSKYTININTEMNYWPAETCGLPECHLPLFDLLERMYPHRAKGGLTVDLEWDNSLFRLVLLMLDFSNSSSKYQIR